MRVLVTLVSVALLCTSALAVTCPANKCSVSCDASQVQLQGYSCPAVAAPAPTGSESGALQPAPAPTGNACCVSGSAKECLAAGGSCSEGNTCTSSGRFANTKLSCPAGAVCCVAKNPASSSSESGESSSSGSTPAQSTPSQSAPAPAPQQPQQPQASADPCNPSPCKEYEQCQRIFRGRHRRNGGAGYRCVAKDFCASNPCQQLPGTKCTNIAQAPYFKCEKAGNPCEPNPCEPRWTRCVPANQLQQSVSGTPFQCVPATCEDGIQNQDETGIDCGGRCKVCVSKVLPKEECDSSAGVLCGEWRLNTHAEPADKDPLRAHNASFCAGNNVAVRFNHLRSSDRKVDVVLHYHGATSKRNEDALCAKVDASGLNLGRRFNKRPTVAIVALGKFDGADCKPTDFNCRQDKYSFPSLLTMADTAKFISYVLDKFAAAKLGNDAKLSVGRLIFAAHGTGGEALTSAIKSDPAAAQTIHELHLFDSAPADVNPLLEWVAKKYEADSKEIKKAQNSADKADYMEKKGSAFRVFLPQEVKQGSLLQRRLQQLKEANGHFSSAWYRATAVNDVHYRGLAPKDYARYFEPLMIENASQTTGRRA